MQRKGNFHQANQMSNLILTQHICTLDRLHLISGLKGDTFFFKTLATDTQLHNSGWELGPILVTEGHMPDTNPTTLFCKDKARNIGRLAVLYAQLTSWFLSNMQICTHMPTNTLMLPAVTKRHCYNSAFIQKTKGKCHATFGTQDILHVNTTGPGSAQLSSSPESMLVQAQHNSVV